MSLYEIIAIIISAFALCTTGINVIFYILLTRKYNGLVQEQNNISSEQNKICQGQAETQLRELIMNARNTVCFYGEKLAFCDSNSENDDIKRKVYKKMFDVAQESLRNAYEEACSRYLDCKIDQERFKRMYIDEIRKLVEDKEQKKYFEKVTSKYKCILKVYDEWFNLEK